MLRKSPTLWLFAGGMAVLFLAGIGSAAGQSRERFEFKWPEEVTVKVTETVRKQGTESTLTYDLHCAKLPDDQTGKRVITLENFRFVEMNGRPVRLEMKAVLEAAEKSLEALPDFVISRQGTLTDIQGLEEAIEALGAGVGQLPEGLSPETAQQVLRTQTGRRIVMQAVAEYWEPWVEAWLGFPVPPGEVQEQPFQSQAPGAQASFVGIRTRSHLGAAPDKPGQVHLKSESVADDPNVTRSFQQSILQSLKEAGQNVTEADVLATLPQIRVRTAAEVHTDPKTLRPTWARREKHMDAPGNPGAIPPELGSEVHEYVFEWPE